MTETGDVDEAGDLHGRPTSEELLDAVIAFIKEQVSVQPDGPLRHQFRIAVRALEIVARELQLGPEQTEAHTGRLLELGVESDGALAVAIREGQIPDSPLLRAALRQDTRDRLLVANPKWLPAEP